LLKHENTEKLDVLCFRALFYAVKNSKNKMY